MEDMRTKEHQAMAGPWRAPVRPRAALLHSNWLRILEERLPNATASMPEDRTVEVATEDRRAVLHFNWLGGWLSLTVIELHSRWHHYRVYGAGLADFAETAAAWLEKAEKPEGLFTETYVPF